MAKGNLNLKALFTADTSGIKSGAKEATQSIKDFESGASGVLNKFTGLFGTSFGQINQVLSTFKGGLLTAEKAAKTAAVGSGIFSKALGILKVAIMSTGIGALVVALGSLIAYFTSSQRGAEKLQRVMAPIKQVFAVIKDFAVKLGEKIVWCFENPGQAIKQFIGWIKDQIMNRIYGLIDSFGALGKIIKSVFTLDWDGIKQGMRDFGNATKQVITGMTEEQRTNAANALGKAWSDAGDKIARANELEKRRQEFKYKELEAEEKMAKLREQINAARLEADDRERNNAAERLKYNKQAIALTNQLYAIEKGLAQERYDMKVEENSLSETMFDDLKEEKELKMALNAVEAQRLSTLKEMTTKNAELLNQVEKERQEREKQLAIERQQAELAAKKQQQLTLKPVILSEDIQQKLSEEGALKPIELEVKPIIKTEEFNGIVADFSKTITSSVTELATSIGESIGNLMTGNTSMRSVMDSIVNIMAKGMKTIGQMLISLGVGMLKLKIAIKSPWTAIAAGIAMVALATAVSAAVSGTISGMTGGGGASGVSGDGGSYAIPQGNTSTLSASNNIKVDGKLTADGDKLVAVINTVNNRDRLTK